ncbi:polyphosphate polymerase domain-containing protein [Prolixibacteraceae bacterium JC049]|nr:polyphosphate polymerase domain-containing protein [Prolixibacteraceae bacterium JC049]
MNYKNYAVNKKIAASNSEQGGEFMDKSIEQIKKFAPITLKELLQVHLMDRYDQKFWTTLTAVPELLKEMQGNYQVLHINNNPTPLYATTYFDTPDFEMYQDHHEDIQDRYKVRRRCYMETGEHFLEVKHRFSEFRTIKTRIATTNTSKALTNEEGNFIQEKTNFDPATLQVAIQNQFNRITLVDVVNHERLTIDLNLRLTLNGESVEFGDLAIIETKQLPNEANSKMVDLIAHHHIHHIGLSKYCTGQALLNPKLQYNNFTPRLSFLEQFNSK